MVQADIPLSGTYRQQLEQMLINEGETPSGVLNENLIKMIVVLLERVEALEGGALT